MKLAEIALEANSITNWKHNVTRNKNILLYKSIKVEFYTETYIVRIKNKINRPLLARLKAACLDWLVGAY